MLAHQLTVQRRCLATRQLECSSNPTAVLCRRLPICAVEESRERMQHADLLPVKQHRADSKRRPVQHWRKPYAKHRFPHTLSGEPYKATPTEYVAQLLPANDAIRISGLTQQSFLNLIA